MHIPLTLKSPPLGEALSGLQCHCLEGAGLPAAIWSFDAVESVLDIAHRLVAADMLPPWGSCLARSQSGGRGQVRRHWHSPEGNIYAVLRLPAEPPFNCSQGAPAVGGLAVAALAQVLAQAHGHAHDVRVKWPNDMVLLRQGNPCKVGGILLEERGGSVLAGMGINVLSAPAPELLRRDAAMPAICLAEVFDIHKVTGERLGSPKAQACAVPSAAESLWSQLVSAMYFWYTNKFVEPRQWQLLAEERLLWKGRAVTVDEDGQCTHGILVGLAPSGGVLVRTAERVEEFYGGSLRPQT